MRPNLAGEERYICRQFYRISAENRESASLMNGFFFTGKKMLKEKEEEQARRRFEENGKVWYS